MKVNKESDLDERYRSDVKKLLAVISLTLETSLKPFGLWHTFFLIGEKNNLASHFQHYS